MPQTPVPVAILGGSGYTAVELIKILLRHPGVAIAAVTSRQAELVAELHPVLAGRLDLRCEPFDPDRLKIAWRHLRLWLLAARREHGIDSAAARARHPSDRSQRGL